MALHPARVSCLPCPRLVGVDTPSESRSRGVKSRKVSQRSSASSDHGQLIYGRPRTVHIPAYCSSYSVHALVPPSRFSRTETKYRSRCIRHVSFMCLHVALGERVTPDMHPLTWPKEEAARQPRAPKPDVDVSPWSRQTSWHIFWQE